MKKKSPQQRAAQTRRHQRQVKSLWEILAERNQEIANLHAQVQQYKLIERVLDSLIGLNKTTLKMNYRQLALKGYKEPHLENIDVYIN